MTVKEKGFNAKLKDDYNPIVLSLGDEIVEIRKSKRDSANCRTINIRSGKEVNISIPTTRAHYEKKIRDLESENKDLRESMNSLECDKLDLMDSYDEILRENRILEQRKEFNPRICLTCGGIFPMGCRCDFKKERKVKILKDELRALTQVSEKGEGE